MSKYNDKKNDKETDLEEENDLEENDSEENDSESENLSNDEVDINELDDDENSDNELNSDNDSDNDETTSGTKPTLMEQEDKKQKEKQILMKSINIPEIDVNELEIENNSSENSEDESDEEDYLQKFENDIRKDYIKQYHPELVQENYKEIMSYTKVVRDKKGNVIDPLHKTLPFLTKFERTRIIGLRTKQLNSGADPFIDVPETIIEGNIIANMELEKKIIPYIIVRPLPSGRKEFWKLSDLELIDY